MNNSTIDHFFDWSQYDFSESERNIWRKFFGAYSQYYRLDIDEHFNVEEIAELDRLICRMPAYDGEWLYRCCYKEEPQDFNVGDVFIPMCNLTTSVLRYFWRDDDDRMSHKYLIRTLPKNKTKAHDLRVIRCDTDDKHEGEQQVNFELGTKFRIDHIEVVTGKKHIYMTEIE